MTAMAKGPPSGTPFVPVEGKIADASNGHRACEHYTRWPEDVELISQLGVKAYRFSMSWPRVQPDGQGAWNEAGFAFYDRVIHALTRSAALNCT
jgi:beta-glucosidase